MSLDTAPTRLIHCTGSGYVPDVADKKRKTPQRTIAIEKELWDPLVVVAGKAGYERAAVIRQFIRWYIRMPGAELPQRPE